MVGAAVARALAAAGSRVLVVEAVEPGAGTSGTSFAWINASAKEPRAYFDLNVAAMRLHREEGSGDWYVRAGHVRWAEPDSPAALALRDRDARLQSWGYRVETISRDRLGRLEPGLALPPRVAEASRYPDEAFVHPDRFLRHLLGQARSGGAALRIARVERMDVAGSRVTGIGLAGGEAIAADAVVLCAGRWTAGLASTVGVEVPLVEAGRGSPAVGMLASTAPVPVRLRSVVSSPGLNLRPERGGRLLLQALDLDAGVEPAQPPGLASAFAREMHRRLAVLVPAAAASELEAMRLGVRALPADGLPVVGWAPGLAGLYLAVTHSGMTLAPLLGRLVAAEVAGGDQPELGPFRPQRFSHRRPGGEQVPPRAGRPA